MTPNSGRRLLHRSQIVGVFWALMALPLGILLLLTIFLGVLALRAEHPAVTAGMGAICLVLVGIMVWVVQSFRQRFDVTTEGIEMRGILRTVTVPWEEVARIEVDRRFFARGGVVVVTTRGRTHRPRMTWPRMALMRGETLAEVNRAWEWGSPPARAARAAHQEHLAHRRGTWPGDTA
ncbi:PH domain-containing protein [Kytococcus sedentarius]|uniref:PH domain-containing protein n=1 Tax=Kytococcus sedentarius TaxID=1276 RepID=UPI0035BC2CE9